MTDYQGLKYKTQDDANPQGRPRVFFCCHSEDFERMFEAVKKEILDIQENAAIWYYDPKEGIPEGENFLADLSQMQLFVIPVTAKFLYEDNSARNVEFAYAVDHHIPVLPLMQEAGMESDFNRICGNLQFLDKAAAEKDETAIPYEEKLKKFLESVLVGDELAQKVRNAFAAYIFLSYRKKDRKYAQDIMKRIHKNDFCRDIAIWYDEFLTPGENFNDAIAGAMEKSSAFAFVVTPNLLENPNYVMTVEYPEAKKTGKPILPIQGKAVNAKKLAVLYDGIDAVITEKELPAKLRHAVGEFAAGENNTDPVHEYLIGLAYLSGIDMEVDHERALTLISGAAEKGLPVAYQKLVSMYRTGEGVERNYEKAIELQKKYAALLVKRYNASHGPIDLLLVVRAYWSLGDFLKEKGKTGEAKQSYETMLQYAKKMDGEYRKYYTRMCSNLLGGVSHDEGSLSETRKWYKKNLNEALKNVKKKRTDQSLMELSSSYYNLGYLSQNEKDLKRAREYYMKALEIREKLGEKDPTADARYALMETYSNLGEISRMEGKLSEQKEWHAKAMEISLKLIEGSNSPKYRRALCINYGKMADICEQEGDLTGAIDWYKKSMVICEKLVEETGVFEDRSHLATSYSQIGTLCHTRGQFPEADTWLKKELAIRKKLAEETNSIESQGKLASVYKDLGSLRLSQTNYKDARAWFTRCLEIREKLAEESDAFDTRYAVASAYEKLALVSSSEKNYSEARSWFTKSLELREKLSKGKNSVNILHDLSQNYSEMGDLCVKEKNYDEAKQWYQRTLDMLTELTERTSEPQIRRDLSRACQHLGDVSKAQGDLVEAEKYYRRGLKIARKLASNTESYTILYCLSDALYRIGTLKTVPESECAEYMKEYIEVNYSIYVQTGNKDYFKTITTAPLQFNIGKANKPGLIKHLLKIAMKGLKGN
ncbi:MAG: tetratricopeptide repeat protein [Solobacterium sp.]|nr:tetratricopeptide repeat protein [Solobacterium sp.]